VLTNLESFEPDHRVTWDENTTFNNLHRVWVDITTVKPDEFLSPFVLVLQLDVVRKICPFCNRLNVVYSGFNLNVERLTSTITIIVDSSRHNSGFVRGGDDNLPYHRFMNTREGSIAPSE